MGLDIYTWLAQRLHRIPANRPQFVSWDALKAQFGETYDMINNFRRVFLQTLRLVYTQYPTARFEVNTKGMVLFHSPPPVPPRFYLVQNLVQSG